jgi:serine/threonine protein kinase
MTKQSLIGATIADTYHIEQKLGAGGMGTVYVAQNVRLGKRYALKVLNPEVANTYPGAVDRFKREAVTAGRLGHVGIVQVHDISQTDDGYLYMVMDLLEGQDLESRMVARGLLPWPDVHRIVTQTCDALATAHEAGIVHRDLKPANIFLAQRRGEGERAVLLDFGVAKVLDAQRLLSDYNGDDSTPGRTSTPTLTKPGTIVGTPNYMSPEQASGIAVDHRADIYSMGAVLFHMIAGRPPFDAESLLAVLTMIAIDPVPPIAKVNPDAPWSHDLDLVIAKAMSKKPEDRFQDIREFAASLPSPTGKAAAAVIPVRAPVDGALDTINQPSTLEMYQLPPEPVAPRTVVSQQISIARDRSFPSEPSITVTPITPSTPPPPAEPRRSKLTLIVFLGLLVAGVAAGAVAALASGILGGGGGGDTPSDPRPPTDVPSKEVLFSRGVADVERAMESESWAEAAGLVSNLTKEFPQREASLRTMREQIDIEMAAAALHRNAVAQASTDSTTARQLCAQIHLSSIYRKREPCKRMLEAPVKVESGDAGPPVGDSSTVSTPTKTPSRPHSLSDQAIMRVVGRNRGSAMRCFNRAFEGGYQPVGSVRVAVRITIASSGRVTSAQLLDSRYPTTASFRVCIENAVRGWEFPESVNGASTEIPFTYEAPDPLDEP